MHESIYERIESMSCWILNNDRKIRINGLFVKIIIYLDKKFLRPTEVDYLKGDFTKARKKLKWKPVITTNELIEDMIEEEILK